LLHQSKQIPNKSPATLCFRAHIQGGPKSKPQTFVYICPILTDFQNFFHWRILWKICIKVFTKRTTTPSVFGGYDQEFGASFLAHPVS